MVGSLAKDRDQYVAENNLLPIRSALRSTAPPSPSGHSIKCPSFGTYPYDFFACGTRIVNRTWPYGVQLKKPYLTTELGSNCCQTANSLHRSVLRLDRIVGNVLPSCSVGSFSHGLSKLKKCPPTDRCMRRPDSQDFESTPSSRSGDGRLDQQFFARSQASCIQS